MRLHRAIEAYTEPEDTQRTRDIKAQFAAKLEHDRDERRLRYALVVIAVLVGAGIYFAGGVA